MEKPTSKRSTGRRKGETVRNEIEALTRDELEAEVLRLRERENDTNTKHRQAIIESVVDFAIVVTDRAGRITDWNTGAERTMGWTAAEMIGCDAERFFTPEDRAKGRIQFEMDEALRAGSASNERWHLRNDGRRFWASGEMMPLRGADGSHRGFVKILRDRTEQRLVGERLRESEARYRTLFDTIDEGFCIVEFIDGPHGPLSDYVRVEANPAYERHTGIAGVVGRTIREMAPGRPMAGLRLTATCYARAARPVRARVRHRRAVHRSDRPPGRTGDPTAGGDPVQRHQRACPGRT